MSSKILFVWDDKRGRISETDKLVNTYLTLSDDFTKKDRIQDAIFTPIKSKASFEEFKKNTSEKAYNSIFILAEPQWDSNANSWYGYEVLHHLLENKETLLDTASDHFRLGIFSIFDREIIHTMIRPELRRFVEVFPPVKLNFDATKKLENKQFDKSSFEFLTKQSINVYTILDSLEHSIAHCFGETDPNGDRFKGFVASYSSKKYALKELTVLSEIGGLINKIQNPHQEIDAANKKKLCNEIEVLLRIAKISTSGNNETIDAKNEKPLKDRHIMIIEDDEPMKNKIAEWLGENGASTRSFRLGSEAIKELEIFRRTKSSSPYHAVITDFEIKDGVFYDIQGTRIIQYIRDASNGFSHIACRLLTSMGKNTVSSTDIFAGIDTKHIIYKRDNSIVPIGGDSDKIIKELADEINLKKRSEWIVIGGPKILQKFVNAFFNLKENKRVNVIKSIFAQAKAAVDDNSPAKTFVFGAQNSKDLEDITEPQLQSFLYNRISVILSCFESFETIHNHYTLDYSKLLIYLKPAKQGRISNSLVYNLGFNCIRATKKMEIIEIKDFNINNGLFIHEKAMINHFLNSEHTSDTWAFLLEYQPTLA